MTRVSLPAEVGTQTATVGPHRAFLCAVRPNSRPPEGAGRGTQSGSSAARGESSSGDEVARFHSREPVSSPRRQKRRKGAPSVDSRPSELDPYPRSRRDLGSAVLWERSLHRSQGRRERARRARRNAPRQKGVTLAAGAAILASPVLAPIASATSARPGVTKNEVAQKAAVSGETTSLLSYGDTGDAVAAVQHELNIVEDGIFGPQTEARGQELAASGRGSPRPASSTPRRGRRCSTRRCCSTAPRPSSGDSVKASFGGDDAAPASAPSSDSTGGPDLSDRVELEDEITSDPAPGAAPESAPEATTPVGDHRRARLLDRRADRRAGHRRHDHRPLRRGPRRPRPQRHRHRRADRHDGPRGRLRHGQHLRRGERLRADGLRPARRRDDHVLRPPVRARRLRERVRQGRAEDRRGRLHRQLHRAARALRGAPGRHRHEPRPVPGGRAVGQRPDRDDGGGLRRHRRRDPGAAGRGVRRHGRHRRAGGDEAPPARRGRDAGPAGHDGPGAGSGRDDAGTPRPAADGPGGPAPAAEAAQAPAPVAEAPAPAPVGEAPAARTRGRGTAPAPVAEAPAPAPRRGAAPAPVAEAPAPAPVAEAPAPAPAEPAPAPAPAPAAEAPAPAPVAEARRPRRSPRRPRGTRC